MVARREGVDVEAVAEPDVHLCVARFQDAAGAGEVAGKVSLDVVLVALDDGHVKARRRARPRHVIRSAAGMGAGARARIGGEVEALRRLRAEEPGRGPAVPVTRPAVAAPERVRDGQRGGRAVRGRPAPPAPGRSARG